MRAEIKVGLIVGFIVLSGAGIWWVNRGEEQMANLPFDKDQMEDAPAEGLGLVEDAAPSVSPGARQPTVAPARRPATVVKPPLIRRASDPGPADGEGGEPAAESANETPLTSSPPAVSGDKPLEVAAEPAESEDAAATTSEPPSAGDPLSRDKPTLRVLPPSRRESAADRPTDPRNSPARRLSAPARKKYVIEPGDRLIDLAIFEYDDGDLWKAIKAANPDIDEDRLRIGQTIEIPSREEALELTRRAAAATSKPGKTPPSKDAKRAGEPTYVVGQGDSLIKIARNVLGDESRWREIFELNQDELESPDVIQPGMELRLPPKQKRSGAEKTEE